MDRNIRFLKRHHNRLEMPDKHILIVEDDIDNQMLFAQWARSLFAPQGKVQIDFVCSGVSAACIMGQLPINLVILDHDLPIGNGSDLIKWMHHHKKKIPIITASGIPENNTMMVVGCNAIGMEVYEFWKPEVIDGKANDIVKKILGV